MEYNLKSLSTIAVLIVVAVVLLGVGISINDTIGEDLIETTQIGVFNSTIQLNDTLPAGIPENANPNCQIATPTLTNATGGETISATGNWTYVGCVFTGNATSPYNGQNVNVSGQVTYDSYSDGYYAAGNGTEAMSNVSIKVPLIATIVALAVILTLIFGAFALRKF